MRVLEAGSDERRSSDDFSAQPDRVLVLIMCWHYGEMEK